MAESEVRDLIHEVAELEAEQELVPPAPHLPPLAVPEVASGRIIIALILFYALAFGIRLLFLEGPSLLTLLKSFAKQGVEVPQSPSILFDYFVYMCFACQFMPIPTLPPIAFTAKAFHWVIVAAIGAVGTSIANLNDYAILGWLFRHQRVKKIRDIQTYRKFLSFFDRHAFLTLSVGSFLPIPVDVIRLLAISRAYSISRYMLATFAGRFPRYLILAYAGKELSVKYILILFGITLIPAAYKLFSDIIKQAARQ